MTLSSNFFTVGMRANRMVFNIAKPGDHPELSADMQKNRAMIAEAVNASTIEYGKMPEAELNTAAHLKTTLEQAGFTLVSIASSNPTMYRFTKKLDNNTELFIFAATTPDGLLTFGASSQPSDEKYNNKIKDAADPAIVLQELGAYLELINV